MIESLYPCFQHWSKKGAVYLVSDTHFNDLDRKLMGYHLCEEDQFYLLKDTCHKNDTLIHLGDVGNTKWIQKLNCYKVLIMGNHDQGASNFQKKEEVIDLDQYTIEEVEQMVERKEIDRFSIEFHSPFIRGYKNNNLFDEVYTGPLWISKKIVLSHEPLDLRCYETNENIAFNIHGHDHSGKEMNQHHFNIVPNKRGFCPWNLNQFIKTGFLKDIKDVHRVIIDNATAKKETKEMLHEWYIDTGVENV